MTHKLLDEGTVRQIRLSLLERFGEPIGSGDGQGIPTSDKKKDMGNRGFGAKLESNVCEGCGCMAEEMDEGPCCDQCGTMQDEETFA